MHKVHRPFGFAALSAGLSFLKGFLIPTGQGFMLSYKLAKARQAWVGWSRVALQELQNNLEARSKDVEEIDSCGPQTLDLGWSEAFLLSLQLVQKSDSKVFFWSVAGNPRPQAVRGDLCQESQARSDPWGR